MTDNTPPVAHTPLPYLREGTLIYALDESGSVNRISMRLEGGYTGRNRERTTDEELEATAAFIAHAVNSHSDLVEAQQSEIEKLRADCKKLQGEEVATGCEACGAWLLSSDDYATDWDGSGCSGCWAAMTDNHPSSANKPCYAYRVGKPDARAILTKAEAPHG